LNTEKLPKSVACSNRGFVRVPKSWPYQVYLYGIATAPILGLIVVDFETIQKTYAVVGALFIPMLAAVLLAMNGRAKWVGEQYKNSWITSLVLAGAVLFFLLAGGMEISEQLTIGTQ